MRPRVWQYRLSRKAGRLTAVLVAGLTLKRMPPFVAAAAIIERDGSILMVRDPAQQQLVLPGGYLRWPEGVEEGVRREVREETGYQIDITEIAGVYGGPESRVEPGVVRVLVVARIAGGREQASAEGDIVWVELGEVMNGSWRDARLVGDWYRRRSRTPTSG